MQIPGDAPIPTVHLLFDYVSTRGIRLKHLAFDRPPTLLCRKAVSNIYDVSCTRWKVSQ
jgi:hypothetical protein